jgi:hypothetical protein
MKAKSPCAVEFYRRDNTIGTISGEIDRFSGRARIWAWRINRSNQAVFFYDFYCRPTARMF